MVKTIYGEKNFTSKLKKEEVELHMAGEKMEQGIV